MDNCSRQYSYIFFLHSYIYFFFNFSEKIRFRISYDSSARQRIHMKCHILPSLEKKKEKKRKKSFIMSSVAVVTGTLRFKDKKKNNKKKHTPLFEDYLQCYLWPVKS